MDQEPGSNGWPELMPRPDKKVTCPYCRMGAHLTTGKEIYPNRKDLFSLSFWICRDCNAYVGCHRKGTFTGEGYRKTGTIPMGTLANKELRLLRSHSHRHFDPIWKDGPMTRKTAYLILANSLEIDVSKCHISQFSKRQCEKTIRICKENKFRGRG